MPKSRRKPAPQLTIFEGRTDTEQRFLEFHTANPGVYKALVTLARRFKGRGHEKCSIKMLYEVCRWEFLMGTDTKDGFKLNNIFTSRYSRLIMESEPDLRDFFNTRELNS